MSEMVELQKKLAGCTRCTLGATRTNLVFGEGPDDASIMFIGEGPGAIEDRSGRPFVGRSGRFLRKAMNKVGINPKEVWIGNVVKCRPPKNRDPEPIEVRTCSPFLHEQIAIVKPDVLVALGRFAANMLIDLEGLSMGTLRRQDRVYSRSPIPIICCYHPMAVLMRAEEGSKKAVREFISDLKEAKDLAQSIREEESLFDSL